MNPFFSKLVLTILLLVGIAPPAAIAAEAAPRQATSQQASQQAAEKADSSVETVAEAPAAVVSRATIQEKLKTLESAGLDEASQKRIVETYQSALDALTNTEQQQEELKTISKRFDDQPQDVKELRRQLAEPLPAPPEFDANAELTVLERQSSELEQKVRETGQKLAKLQAEPAARAARLSELPSSLADAQQQLAELTENLPAATGAETVDPEQSAKQTLAAARIESLKASIDLMQKQLQYYASDGEVLKLRQDLRARELAAQEKRLAKLREVVNQRRKAEASAQASAAARDAEKQRPEPIAALANRNAELAKLGEKITAELADLSEAKQKISSQNLALKTNFARIQERVKTSGLSEGIGQLLRQEQANLPDLQDVKRRQSERSEKESEAVFTQYELSDERGDLAAANLDEQVNKVMAQLPGGDPAERARQRREIRELLETKREYLDSLLDNYSTYSVSLTTLGADEEELINRTNEYAAFIAKRVLWIRSCLPLGRADLRPAIDAAAWSLDPSVWRDAGAALWSALGENPYQLIFVCLAMIVLLSVQRRARSRLREIGAQAAKPFCTDFSITPRALWLTLVTALPWPVLLWFAGWWMNRPWDESEFVRSLSQGLRFTAWCLLLLEFLRQLCRSGGLADAHFEWPQACLVQVRRNLRWLTWVVLPLVLWFVGLENQRVEPLWSSSLGRVLFIVVMLLLTYVLRRILLASGSPLLIAMKQSTKSWVSMLHRLWGPALVLLPTGLALLAAWGYYYTVLHIAVRLLATAALILMLSIFGGLTQRWILTTRRRLARESARKRREQASATATPDGNVVPAAELAEETVDLKALGAQTLQLIHTILMVLGIVAAAFIWSEMLSAVAFIGSKPIFPIEGGLTWGQLLLFVVIAIVAWAAARDLPAMLDFAILQHLPMDSGSRYAVTAVCRYLLAALGAALAFNAVGFHWDSIQWLVAAMGVGLGFGLQEIFANFVSGIILLFERPIRVGDIITLGDCTGVVNRIRMRSTTIVDWDRKEYVVPNKDLVTGRLLNWTLSDHTNRIVIEVGVAYGSDTELACQLLREAAQENPLILADPSPVTSFDKFADSTLNLTLRCYLPNLDNRLATIHALHTAIDKKFREAEIEIAFPQADLHVRSLPPGLNRMTEQGVGSNGSESHRQN